MFCNCDKKIKELDYSVEDLKGQLLSLKNQLIKQGIYPYERKLNDVFFPERVDDSNLREKIDLIAQFLNGKFESIPAQREQVEFVINNKLKK